MAENRHIDLRLNCRLLDRYVGREFLVSYGIAVLVVLTLRILLDLFVQFDEFIETQRGSMAVLGNIVDYYGPKVFEYFRDFSGTMIIMAAAFSLARLMKQNELTAVLASGISLKRVIAPVVLLGFGLNILMILDQELILPKLAHKLVRKHDEVERLGKISIWLLPDRDGALLCARQFDPQLQILRDVTIIQRQGGQVVGRITARQANWNEALQCWDLEDGSAIRRTGEAESGVETAVDRYYSDLTAEYLWLQRNRDSKSLMSSADLSRLLRKEAVKLRPMDRREAICEKHFRFTDPIINMVMLLTGLPLLVSRERRSTKTAIFLALAGSGGCFVATFVCKLLAGDMLGPLWAGWLPIIIFLPLSVLALDSLKT
jgi:lipopolysaccharide export system permease protein